MTEIENHWRMTKQLALSLRQPDIFYWLSRKGYFPENYVLPPCYQVIKTPNFGKRFTPINKRNYSPIVSQLIQTHFPKSEFTDKTFSIIHPYIHNDISLEIARNWKKIIKVIFDPKNKVYSYSFPIPISIRTKGKLGELRSGRMIYEFIEMAERDIASEAYKYSYLIKADIKNFYSSVYTHSIAWAIHKKNVARKMDNRWNYNFVGN